MTESKYPDAEDLRRALLTRADEYSRAARISLSDLGKKIVNQKGFFSRIGRGDNFTVETYARVMKWFDENPPPASGVETGSSPVPV